MNLLVFDWKGKIGHFRRLDTNSSSLTYRFPSRTAIAGMIAGLLGYEKDSYYEVFSPEKCRIALSSLSPVRKIMQNVNYLFVKTKGDLNGVSGHTQIPVEFLFPSLKKEHIIFRIYFWHSDEKIYNKTKEFLQLKKAIYPPYMGLSELLSTVEFVKEITVQRIESSMEKVRFHTVVRASELLENSLEFLPDSKFSKEFMTRRFDKDRNIIETDSYLLEVNNQLIGIPRVPYYHFEEENKNILFM